MLNSQKIRHEPTPTYLGVTLDHSLTFKEHLTRTAKKYWQNLPAQVGEPIRRSFAPLSLHYATQLLNIVPLSGHDLLIWVCSQLNSTMQIITATLKPTPTPWLPVLANIAPPSLRWKEATDKLILKISDHSYWPIYKDIYEHPDQRLVPTVEWLGTMWLYKLVERVLGDQLVPCGGSHYNSIYLGVNGPYLTRSTLHKAFSFILSVFILDYFST